LTRIGCHSLQLTAFSYQPKTARGNCWLKAVRCWLRTLSAHSDRGGR
jgi:hypothetical protein